VASVSKNSLITFSLKRAARVTAMFVSEAFSADHVGVLLLFVCLYLLLLLLLLLLLFLLLTLSLIKMHLEACN
jgi:hypothetical protein